MHKYILFVEKYLKENDKLIKNAYKQKEKIAELLNLSEDEEVEIVYESLVLFSKKAKNLVKTTKGYYWIDLKNNLFERFALSDGNEMIKSSGPQHISFNQVLYHMLATGIISKLDKDLQSDDTEQLSRFMKDFFVAGPLKYPVDQYSIEKFEDLFSKSVNKYEVIEAVYVNVTLSLKNRKAVVKTNLALYAINLALNSITRNVLTKDVINHIKKLKMNNPFYFKMENFYLVAIDENLFYNSKVVFISRTSLKECPLGLYQYDIDKNNGLILINGEDLSKLDISEEQIKFYSIYGSEMMKSDVKGSGGGSSIGKALVGGFIAGGAGAIVASRNKTNIETENELVDNRQVQLNFDNEYIVFDGISIYQDLLGVFPNKDKDSLNQANSPASDSKTSENKTDVFEQLKKLKELLDMEIITVEEFNQKKKELLNL